MIRLPLALLAIICLVSSAVAAPLLDKRKQLDAQTFWANRDFDWFEANIPFFECPDAEINTTYYYRWELVTRHMIYGSPNSGYSFTEFANRPSWSGAYGGIACPSGHQIYEIRWLKDPEFARDFLHYWFRTPGAQPRNYSSWLADCAVAVDHVHPNKAFLVDLLPDLEKHHEAWRGRQWVDEMGMFWQTGHADGMEFNINSRQTKDIHRGDHAFRPTFNTYMWADLNALAEIAEMAGDPDKASSYRKQAAALKTLVQEKLWDPKRQFFFPMSSREETDKEGNVVKAHTLTYESGQFAGSPHGRELHGYVPWAFNLPDPGKESAWKFLMDPEYFQAPFGPSTTERNDPMFLLQKDCCWWSGQSWPFATTQTLKAMANVLHNYPQEFISRADYAELLHTFAISHRKDGKPYIAEALHPDTGSWEGHDMRNRSEHYFHSNFNDLVITGLAGLKADGGDTLTIDPLAPDSWDYFALDAIPYQGHEVAICWDKKGDRYGHGAGLHVLVDGKKVASSPKLGKLEVKLPAAREVPLNDQTRFNYAVNNDGDYFPYYDASHTGPESSLAMIYNGQYRYDTPPTNRWTSVGSTEEADWVSVDSGDAPRYRHHQAVPPRRWRRRRRPLALRTAALGRQGLGRSPRTESQPEEPGRWSLQYNLVPRNAAAAPARRPAPPERGNRHRDHRVPSLGIGNNSIPNAAAGCGQPRRQHQRGGVPQGLRLLPRSVRRRPQRRNRWEGFFPHPPGEPLDQLRIAQRYRLARGRFGGTQDLRPCRAPHLRRQQGRAYSDQLQGPIPIRRPMGRCQRSEEIARNAKGKREKQRDLRQGHLAKNPRHLHPRRQSPQRSNRVRNLGEIAMHPSKSSLSSLSFLAALLLAPLANCRRR